MGKKLAVAFLQNMWVRDPAAVRAGIARRGEEYRRRVIEYSLFAGCLTGRRIKAAFGEKFIKTILWEEASREIAGDTFRAFLSALESLGYRYRWDYLTAADYGDATTRRRFFLYATRGRGPLAWPARSHLADPAGSLFQAAPWRPAREVIDWTIPGHSIFLTREDVRRHKVNVQRPLRPNTLRRIEAGIRKFWGEWAEPFLVLLRGTSDGQIDRHSAIRLDRPLPTTTACGHVGLVQPFVTALGQTGSHGGCIQSAAAPLGTLVTKAERCLVQPLIVSFRGNHAGRHDADGRVFLPGQPLRTQDTSNRYGVLQPFILNQDQRGRDRGMGEPLPTIVTSCSHGLVQPFLIRYNGTSQAFSIAEPISTIDTHDRLGLVRPMLVEAGGQRYLLDILFRMLTVKELAAAHSFPSDYFFAGTKSDQVKQIGNSVPVRLAEALARQALSA